MGGIVQISNKKTETTDLKAHSILEKKDQDFLILEINVDTVILGLIISWFILSL